MTLLEKGLECRKHDVNLFVSAQYDPEYLKLNPKGFVPTLIHIYGCPTAPSSAAGGNVSRTGRAIGRRSPRASALMRWRKCASSALPSGTAWQSGAKNIWKRLGKGRYGTISSPVIVGRSLSLGRLTTGPWGHCCSQQQPRHPRTQVRFTPMAEDLHPTGARCQEILGSSPRMTSEWGSGIKSDS